MSKSAETVAVIGVGPLGLSAIKNLTEDGFDVTGFETRDYLGGVWKYSTDSAISVQESTVFNSSRYRSAFTDFPFGPDADDFPTWQQFHKYINDYADHFDVRRKVKLNTSVESVTREDGKWLVRVKAKDGTARTETFDKVVVANGYFTAPKWPKYDGLEKFKGQTLHAINFHHPEQYDGKNVLLIGLHATSQDVAKSLVGHAKKVYVSHRNGLLLIPRYGPNGEAFDTAQSMKLTKMLMFFMDRSLTLYGWLFHKVLVNMMKQGFPNLPAAWNFLPAPPALVSNPVLGDDLYELMESGWAEPVAGVGSFTGARSVQLKDGRVLDDVDAVIYCTGYNPSTPFLKGDLNPYPVIGEQANLYRNLFLIHPDADVRNSIAFVGHGGVVWPGLSLFELQSAAVGQIWRGNAKLPSLEGMKKWHADLLATRRKLFASNPYESSHLLAVMLGSDPLRWLDDTAGTDVFSHFGWGWKAWKFWWQDRQFYNLCNTGVFSAALWRLFETGKRKAWAGAREQIYKDNEAVKEGIKRRKAYLESMKEN